MDSLLNDLRYSLRRLTRAPVFALVAIATLALGIGANSAIFSFVNAVLFKAPGGVRATSAVRSTVLPHTLTSRSSAGRRRHSAGRRP
jgi:hypothetical protein